MSRQRISPARPPRRAAAVAKASAAAPDLVHQAIQRTGKPLDPVTRASMEQRFAHDFSRVRVHSDDLAAKSAAAVNASAYTVGPDVVFGAGLYAPTSTAGTALLTHELTHVVQQEGQPRPTGRLEIAEPGEPAEREADTIARRGAAGGPVTAGAGRQTLHRQPSPGPSSPAAPGAAPPTGMSRSAFERTMRQRYLVQDIHTGAFAEQVTRLTRPGLPAGSGLARSAWQSWDPGTSSDIYSWIIAAFEELESGLGGVPRVKTIIFFDMAFELNPAGAAVPHPEVGASFGAGELVIYRAAITARSPLPISRSNASGSYPPVGIGVAGIPGQSPGAPLPLPDKAQSAERTIEHELGHGIAEAAMAVAPSTFVAYRREVGWTPGTSAELYDVGVPAVRQALAGGTQPPAAYKITGNDWNAPRWIEQPLTIYMVTGGPAEDFAEAVMAYVNSPALLASRSPQRFKFINSGKESWLPQLLKTPQVGDFPMPRGDRRVG